MITAEKIRRALMRGQYGLTPYGIRGDPFPVCRRMFWPQLQQSGIAASMRRTAGGAWTDTIATPASGTADNTNSQYAQRITLAAGTAAKLRYYNRSGNGNAGLKLALYNSSQVLLASDEKASPAGTGWIEIDITPTAVSAGDYFVSFCTELGGTATITSSYVSTSGVTSYYTTRAYSTFPPDPFPTASNYYSYKYAVGVFLT